MFGGSDPKWIQAAIKHRGALLAEAKLHGYSKATPFAREVVKRPAQFSKMTVRRAHLALTLEHLRRKKGNMYGGSGILEWLIGKIFPSAEKGFKSLDASVKRARAETGRGGAFEVVEGQPKVVREFIAKYGDNLITHMRVCRVPLASMLTRILNFVTLGKLDSEAKRLGYDAYYHLYLVLTLDSGQTVLLEKNQRVAMGLNNGAINKPGAECRDVKLPSTLHVRRLLAAAEHHFSTNRLYVYSVAENNCQRFVSDILTSNGLSTPELQKFIMQDVSNIVSSSGILSKLANKVTNFAHKVNTLWQGGHITSEQAHEMMRNRLSRV
jgi:hypothetical protein